MAGSGFSERLSPEQALEVERIMREGVEHGLLRRHDTEIAHVLWRYDAIHVRAILICYELHAKRRDHALVVQQDEGFGRLALAGDWVALAAELGGPSAGRAGRQSGKARSKTAAARSPFGSDTDAEPSPMAELTLLADRVDKTQARRTKRLRRADLSPHQAEVYEQVMSWAKDPSPLLTLGGYAGTGKTTLVAAVAGQLHKRRIAFCAPSGKAALVMRQKLQAAGLQLEGVNCGTIHSLIYQAKFDRRSGRSRGFAKAASLPYDLLIVDEASMIGDKLFADLSSFDIPVLALGDHGQLAPVQGRLNLMAEPDLCLTEIHRQAQGHPLIEFAAAVRESGEPFDKIGEDPRLRGVKVHNARELRKELGSYLQEPDDARETVLLCYTNRTRVWLNKLLRDMFAMRGELAAGDSVICLRNAYLDGQLLANGARGIVEEVQQSDEFHLRAVIRHDDDRYRVHAALLRQQIGRPDTIDAYDKLGFAVESWYEVGLLYDHGYALTVHKSQGSQFRRVVLILERPGSIAPENWRRWLYTGATRAVEELVLIERV